MKKLTIALIGCGARGNCYTQYALDNPDKFQIVALADPVKEKRDYFKNLHNVSDDMCFDSWEALLKKPKLADLAFICTQDRMHVEPAIAACEKKYDILLEKPAAPTPEECAKIVKVAQKAGVKVVVCHVLRYTPFYRILKDAVSEGKVGDIVNIIHTEGVGNIHQSHSYVRGNWRNVETSSPMILAKSCHDVDLMQWLIGEPCTKVQSFGSLSYFTKENAPEDAPDYCLDGCPRKDTCFYYVTKAYKHLGWGASIIANKFHPTDEDVEKALKKGPYGRCVFKCDNDVVDHQVVNMQFGKDKLVAFTMSAFNKGGRHTKIMGTKGEITADMSERSIVLYNFATREKEVLLSSDPEFDELITGGHGGGDKGIMIDLYEYIANGKRSDAISDIAISCKNHMIAFAAEHARVTGTIVDMEKYEESFCFLSKIK